MRCIFCRRLYKYNAIILLRFIHRVHHSHSNTNWDSHDTAKSGRCERSVILLLFRFFARTFFDGTTKIGRCERSENAAENFYPMQTALPGFPYHPEKPGNWSWPRKRGWKKPLIGNKDEAATIKSILKGKWHWFLLVHV